MEKDEVSKPKGRKVTREEALAKLFNSPSPSKKGYWYFSAEEFEAVFPLLPPLELPPKRNRVVVADEKPKVVDEDAFVAAKTKLTFDDVEDDATQDGLGFNQGGGDGLVFEESQLPEDSEGIEDSFACWYNHLHPRSNIEAHGSCSVYEETVVPDSIPKP